MKFKDIDLFWSLLMQEMAAIEEGKSTFDSLLTIERSREMTEFSSRRRGDTENQPTNVTEEKNQKRIRGCVDQKTEEKKEGKGGQI